MSIIGRKTGYSADDWDDDEKMSFLFSPFRDKSANEHSYDAKMSFWIDRIGMVCREKDIVVLDPFSIPSLFLRKGSLPKCLDTVILEMKSRGLLKTIADFQSNSTWTGWTWNMFVSKPTKWAFSSLFGSNSATVLNKSEFLVSTTFFKEKAKEVTAVLERNTGQDPFDYILKIEDAKKICKTACRDDNSLDLILDFLVSQGVISIQKLASGEMVVKLLRCAKSSTAEITEVESSIFQLKQTICDLSNSIRSLFADVKRLDQEARQHIRNEQKLLAKNTLRQKKIRLQTLEQRQSSLCNLQVLLDRLLHTESEKKIIEAYEAGVRAFKQNQSGDQAVTLDRVDNTIDSVLEVLDDTQEIEDSIAGMGRRPTTGLDLSAEELEKELSDLLNEDNDPVSDKAAADILKELEQLTVADTEAKAQNKSPSRTKDVPLI